MKAWNIQTLRPERGAGIVKWLSLPRATVSDVTFEIQLITEAKFIVPPSWPRRGKPRNADEDVRKSNSPSSL